MDNIKLSVREIEWDGMDWIDLLRIEADSRFLWTW
jgi:hypothetical protein